MGANILCRMPFGSRGGKYQARIEYRKWNAQSKTDGQISEQGPNRFCKYDDCGRKKIIALKQPEAGIIRWIFHQLAKNIYKISEVREWPLTRGLLCSPSNFSKLIRNPVYCGLISVTLSSENALSKYWY